MGNNPNQTQNPGQKAPGQDDQTRRDSNQTNPNDPNRQRTPGQDDNQTDTKKQMQDQR